MDDSAVAALSVIIARSRVRGQHRAYVRFGDTEVGFRDLETGQVFSDDGYASYVENATAGMVSRRARVAANPPHPRVPSQPLAS
jgi:hypothetical protein